MAAEDRPERRDDAGRPAPPWFRSTWLPAAVGAALLWAALPPLSLGPLAFLAPIGWVLLIRVEQLPGRRPYLQLYLVGFFFWLAALHWVRLSHPVAYLGWLGIGFYFAFYVPVFFGLSRMAVHRLRVPAVLAAAVVWTGLELVRGHLLTGMTMAGLGHTQYRWLALIQLGDLAGAYGVSFVVMFVGACLGCVVPLQRRRPALGPLAPAAAMLGAALLYGHVRLAAEPASAAANGESSPERLRVALIQGNIDTFVKFDEEMRQQVYEHYYDLSRGALERFGQVDLMVWPETMFRYPLVAREADARKPEAFPDTEEAFRKWLAEAEAASRGAIGRTAREFGTPMILGVDTWHFAGEEMHLFNSAAFVDSDGGLLGRYDKMHLVVFGEYVPFSQQVSWLKRLTPMQFQCTPGAGPAVFRVGAWRLAPNICYETVLPHVIRRQVNALRQRGEEPDVLVNLTNDGWFQGSSELEMHFACGVFRAVECRKPLLIAANTGISGFIDGSGRILAEGPTRKSGVLLAEVARDGRSSYYLDRGDLPAGLCLAATLALAVVGALGWTAGRWRRRG